MPGGTFWSWKRENLSEQSLLLCGPALDANESAASLDVLRQITLPDAAKFVVATAKFDAQGVAKSVNVQSDYPGEPPYLETLLRWSGTGDLADPRFRDGYDLYCLRRILARQRGFDFAVMLRGGAATFEARWPELQRSVEGRLFLTFDEEGGIDSTAAPVSSFLIDLRDERAGAFLDAGWQLYVTGAVYGLTAYSLGGALSIALDAVQLERSLREPKTGPAADLEESADILADAKDEYLIDNQTA
jgi:hypothetical protein